MDEETLYAEAILGEQASNFFKTDLGRYIAGRAMAEEEEGTKKLITVEPDDSKSIRELQNNIKIAKCAIIWLQEAIISGEQAAQQLDTKEQ